MIVYVGMRRVVRVISIAAWIALAAFIWIAALSYPDHVGVYASSVFGVVAYIIIQAIAWVTAGFSENPKGDDGLIRWPFKS